MPNDLLHGELVRLTSENPDVMASHFAHWNQDTGFLRLLDTEPPRNFSAKKWQEWLEKDLERPLVDGCMYAIRTLKGDDLIGFIGLFELFLHHGDAHVAIALGERHAWNQGYGTDAMRIMLRYAFNELNLRRVSLGVFEYNTRAISSYEKAGFVYEGCKREYIHRDGKRWDFLFMGIFREEWLAKGILTS
ncbi:MAG: GNAT family N-acetyltransferase [Anaerolineales bacterium]|nr:GNAT family N-acetyltransferase [Anaerolineae bacterium]PWB53599.1 MAG: GNAT family N-acetyltransferase [Anaerolineales bacterium]